MAELHRERRRSDPRPSLPAAAVAERLLVLEDILFRTWFHCGLRERTPDGERDVMMQRRRLRAVRLFLFLNGVGRNSGDHA